MDTFLAVFFSLCCAVTFGAFSVIARKALPYATAYANSVIALAVGLVLIGGASIFVSPWSRLGGEAALWFLAAGLISPVISRYFLYRGIQHVGVGRTMPLVALTPFFSAVLAFLWLGERPGAGIYIATTFVVVGSVLVSFRSEGESDWRRIHLLLPITHALLVSITAGMRRQGLILFPDPFVASTISFLASLPVAFLVVFLLPPGERFHARREGWGLLILSGVVVTMAFFLFYVALRYGEMSLVVPLSNSAPIFSIFFARFWLRGEEVLDWKKVAGAVFVSGGVALIFWEVS